MTFRDRAAAIRVLTGEDIVHFRRLPTVKRASYSGGVLTFVLETPVFVSRNLGYRIGAHVQDEGPNGTLTVSWNLSGDQSDLENSGLTVFDRDDGSWVLRPVPRYQDVYEVTYHAHTVTRESSMPMASGLASDDRISRNSRGGISDNFTGMRNILRGL